MSESKTDLRIIGIGNAGRQDDGLGWAFLEAIQPIAPSNVDLVYRYQLNIEDAELISKVSKVLFVDSQISNNGKPFEFKSCEPEESYEFTTHALKPGVIVSLCNKLYNRKPEVYLLTISGMEWELKEGLSDPAKLNLEEAVKSLICFIQK